jgi:hypothetical protein
MYSQNAVISGIFLQLALVVIILLMITIQSYKILLLTAKTTVLSYWTTLKV